MNNPSLKVTFAAGAAAMMAVAWFSCSSSGGSTGCDGSNCNGCCDSMMKCQPSNNATCGVSGATCVACTNTQQCHSGGCIDNGGTGGGSATGGGSSSGGGASSGGGSSSTGGGSGSTGGGSSGGGSAGGGSAAGGGTSSGPTLCTSGDGGTNTFMGCDTWENHTDAGDARTVVFGTNFTATPMCMEIKSGQTVTFDSTNSTHPGAQTCGPVANVIQFSGGAMAMIPFQNAGVYGYQCTIHGFTGAIKVDP
jgi:plastocyanin